MKNSFTVVILGLACVMLPRGHAFAQTGESVALSASLGDTLDVAECQRYGLLSEVNGLRQAQIFRDGGDYRLLLTLDTEGGLETRERKLSREDFEASQRHVAIVERHVEWAQEPSAASGFDATQWQWLGLVLRYASLNETALAVTLLDDLSLDLRESGASEALLGEMGELRTELTAVASDHEGLHGGIRQFDHSGRSDLIRYTGLFGVWAAIALPVTMESEDAKFYAASLMAIPAASVLGVVNWSRERDVNKGRASFMALGGNLGIWHGISWSALGGSDGPDAIGVGLGASVGGYLLGAWATERWKVTEGHGQLSGSSLWWGMWYGVVISALLEHDDGEDTLRSMLWTTAGTVSATALFARGSALRENQIRLINLGGILGTLFGFGVDVLFEVGDETTAFAIAGAGTTAGLLVAWQAVRSRGDDLASVPSISGVELGAAPDRLSPGHTMATLGFRSQF